MLLNKRRKMAQVLQDIFHVGLEEKIAPTEIVLRL